MKKTLLKIVLGIITTISVNNTYAQEASAEEVPTPAIEKESPFSIGVDFISAYVWRGIKYTGPSIQPTAELNLGGFTAGLWGSFDLNNIFNEVDTYVAYGFNFGLSFGLTDYYYQGSNAFDFTDTTGSHALEANLNYTIKRFSASANYVINDTHAGDAGSQGGDMYFQLGYSFKYLDVFVGAGDGWHTENGDFKLSNVGIGITHEIPISDRYKLPVFAQIIVNPDREEFDLVFGVSL